MRGSDIIDILLMLFAIVLVACFVLPLVAGMFGVLFTFIMLLLGPFIKFPEDTEK